MNIELRQNNRLPESSKHTKSTNIEFFCVITVITELQQITPNMNTEPNANWNFNFTQHGTRKVAGPENITRNIRNTDNRRKQHLGPTHTKQRGAWGWGHHWLPEDDGLDALLVLPLLSPWRPRSPEQGAPWFWEAGCPSLVALDTLGRSAAHFSRLYTGSISFAEYKADR